MAERIIRENRRAFKGVWIPAEFWLDKNLSIMEVIVLTEIDSLDNENGCVASNKHFAEFTGLSKNRVSEIINGLKTKGYVNIQYFFDDFGQKRRTMRLNQPVRKSDIGIRDVEGGYSKDRLGYSENRGGYSENRGGYSENRDCRNTVKNTTRNPNIGIQSSSSVYATNGEYIHGSTTASSQLADDDAGRTQPGQSLTRSTATASPAQLQQPAVQPQQPQRQSQPSGWTEPADPTGPDSLADPNGMNAIFRVWTDLWNWPNSTTITDLTGWVKEFGPDVVLYAIKKAATADASRPHAYMAAIIRGYRNAGIKNLDEVKAADQAREQRSQQKQSYGRSQYNRNRGNRANVQEQLPDWAKQDDEAQDKPKTAEQLDGERLERDLHRAVMLQQQLYGVDLNAICHNLDQPNGHGYLSVKAPELFEQYCEQNHLDVAEQIKKARETADFD
ncbi:DnaD domain protein [Limosilactobacillus mucosae]|uniref:DnaD domain protein n=1 Tax=Limosilactobacillus mucosae TaxID=97478 RepID=UPI0022E228C1|nr:DnaD domain protein [Limosilactobacillus mucosae]